jgi:ATF/CREB family transcription factor
MFPAPSPGTASLFASLHAAGGATPNTLEFQRTAISAAAKRDHPPAVLPPPNTSQQNTSAPISTMAATMAPPIESKHAYDHHDNDAANGLFMLAQSRSGHGVQPFPPGPGPAPTSAPLSHPTSAPNRVTLPQQQPAASANAGPSMTTSPVTNGARGASEASGASDDGERLPHVGRSSHKKSNNTSASARRKAEDHLTKTPVSKKIKMSSASPNDDMDNFSDEESMVKMEDANRGDDGDKTKMTDEEKRKNFLERNRVAALKCRQRKKQWLQSLQNKVELFNNENEVLLQENQRLKEEVVNLKTLLMAHKDCPVTQQQGVPGNAYIPPGAMDSFGAMSYGMGAPMPNQQTIIAGQSRRFS